ncbi:MAG: choice-of-anchor L domain-containing protein [Chitinophagales bacterium]|jgi:gliding motility-associated-like protein|nr:choice-of-anchor L domain-containing protein [Sphingobacteriales bacterium]MCC7056838.1 choice-of-anchor L domain-containing protein [Chitinophagales bacterium]
MPKFLALAPLCSSVFFVATGAFTLLISVSQTALAQLNANHTTYNPTQLVEDVLINGGECVEVSGITYTGHNQARGYFTGGQNTVGFESGVILASGRVSNANGPNNAENETSDFGNPGDNDLDLAQPGSCNTHDAAILSFDFVPTQDIASFEYVFGSEEYCEWAPSNFSDVFGFFISGPGISGPYSGGAVNIALIPGTSTPVSINNVNQNTNTTYFIGNNGSCPTDANLNVEYDGLTVVLTATTPTLTPCETYHIKLAVADCSDWILDSGVFLKEGSFNAGNGFSVNTGVGGVSGINLMYEGCETGYFVFIREDTTDLSQPYTITGITLNNGSTATPGVDCNTIPSSFTIPAGQISDTLWINAFIDFKTEGIESLILNIPTGCPCNNSTITKTMLIKDADPLDVNITAPNDTICPNATIDLTAVVTGGAGISTDKTLEWSTGAGNVYTITVNPNGTTTYSVTVTDLCGNIAIDDITIWEDGSPTPVEIIDPGLLCKNNTTIFLQATPPGGTWSGSGITNPNTGAFNPSLANPPYTITYNYTNDCGINSSDQITLNVKDLPTANFLGGAQLCSNSGSTTTLTISLTGTAPWTLTYSTPSGANLTVTINSSPYTLTVTEMGTYTITNVTDSKPCSNTGNTAQVTPVVITANLSKTDPICNNDTNGTITLNPNGGKPPYTITWSDPSLGNLTNVSGLAAGVYSVTVTDADGCLTTATVTLLNPPLPTPPTVPSPTYCQGDPIGTIAAGLPNGTTAQWYTLIPPDTTLVYTGNPFDPTPFADTNTPAIYNFMVTTLSPAGCQSLPTLFNITINPTPNPEFTNTVAICIGDSLLITALNGNSNGNYQWFDAPPPGGNLITGYIDPTSTTTYYLLFTDALTGCTQTTPASVIVNPLPTPAIIGPTIICPTDTATLTASGGVFYLWSTADTTATINTPNAGTYSVTVTDGNGCINTTQHTITIDDLKINATKQDILCPGDLGSIDVTINGGIPPINFTWIGPTNIGNQTAGIGLQPGIYGITATDAVGCADSITLEIIDYSVVMTVEISGVDANCFAEPSGSIELVVSGGAQPVTIVWDGATNISPNNYSPINLLAGTYTATVTDANGCVQVVSITINQPPTVLINFNAIEPLCFGGDAFLEAEIFGGVPPYVYDWQPQGQTTDTLTVKAGTYTLEITDSHGCKYKKSVTINEPPLLEITAAVPTPDYCDQTNGEISLSTNGGTMPYNYVWSPDVGNNTANVSGLNSGTYYVTVTDVNGCKDSSLAVIDSVAGPIAGLPIVTPAICAQNNGTIEVFVTQGSPPYVYIWGGLPNQTTAFADSLAPGTYTITATDIHNCTVEMTATIVALPPPQIDAITVINDACGQGIGSIEVSASGGTGPLLFTWSYPAWNGLDSISGVLGGSYSVTVTDSIGCVVTTAITVPTDPAPQIISAIIGPSHCGQTDGSLNVVALGGTGNLTYQWTPDIGNSTYISGLSANTYNLVVIDERGCTTDTTLTIPDLPAPIIAQIVVTPNYCEQNNGTATVQLNPLGNTNLSELLFIWSHDPLLNSPQATGLTTGNYQITVTDNFGCQDTMSFEILPILPPELSLVNLINEKCTKSNGLIEVTANGGSGALTYTWSPAINNSGLLNNISAGTYSVTVTDAAGCTDEASFEITDSPGPNLSLIEVVDAHCDSFDGSIKVNASGGTAPLKFSWSHDLALNTSDALNIKAGAYSVTVIDANNCIATLTAKVNNQAGPKIAPVLTTDEACGQTNGQIEVKVTGGLEPYTYQWADNILLNTNTRTNLSAGVYNLTVTDAFGCSDIKTFTLNNSLPPTVSVATTPSSCGQADGTTNLSVTGGLTPYNYAWDNGQNSANLSGLKAGTYVVTVTDAAGCQTIVSADISDLGAPQIAITQQQNATCGQANGSAEVNASGGTGTLALIWSSGETGSMLSGKMPGFYSVTVTDANGCSASATLEIADSPGPSLALTSINKANCGQANGAATVTATGGNGNLLFAWSHDAALIGPDATGLPVGSYSVTVTDENGCSTAINFNLDEEAAPTLTVVGTTPAGCNLSDGSATVNGQGGTAPLTYAWSHNPALNSTTANNIASGNYTITVTDAKGCSATVDLTVLSLEAPIITSIDIVNAICGNKNGAATVNFSGGTAPFTFTWSHDALLNNPTANNLDAGAYAVTLTDGKNCTAIASFNITQAAGPTINLLSQANPTCSQNNGAIEIEVIGGSNGVNITWLPNVDNNGQSSANNLPPGVYTISAIDANNCIAELTVLLTDSPGAGANLTTTDAHCGQSDGSISVTTTSGTLPLSFNWSDSNLVGPNQLSLAAGAYSLTITDALGCQVVLDTIINDIPGPSLTVVSTTNSSCGQADGMATLLADGGTGGYTWAWLPNVASAETAQNLLAGLYQITVTDAVGCAANLSFEIKDANAPTLSIIQINPEICSQNNGSILVTATGGDGNYTFTWSHDASLNSPEALALTSGNYSVTVTDGMGCKAVINAEVPFIEGPSISANATNDFCNQNLGSITSFPAGGDGNYTFTWSHDANLNSPEAMDLASGNYSVTVTDGNGCTSLANATVDNILGPNLSVIASKMATCNQANGTATVLATGGDGNYTFSWSHDASLNSPEALGLASGNYSVTVTDGNGCTAAVSFDISNTDSPVLSLEQTTPTHCAQANGIASVTATGGDGNYTFTWSHDANLNNPEALGLASGNYGVTVTDGMGCTATIDFVIPDLPGVALDSISAMPTPCAESLGSATVVATGGQLPYSFEWNTTPPQTTATATNLPPGNYVVTVTDAWGCQITANVIVEGILPAFTLNCSEATGQTITVEWTTPTGVLFYEVIIDANSPLTLPANTNSYTVTDLLPNTAVSVTITPGLPAVCGLVEPLTVICTTLPCEPIDPVITGFEPSYCQADTPVQLIATPQGGTFSGKGVSASGLFDPSLAGAGTHQIIYQYSNEFGCPYSTDILITVYEMPVAAFANTPVICLGDALVLEFTGIAPANAELLWQVGTATFEGFGPHTIYPEETGWLPVLLTINANGCSSTAKEEVGVSAAHVQTIDDQTVWYGESVVLETTGSSVLNGELTYLWDDAYEPPAHPLVPLPTSIAGSNEVSPTVTPSATGWYYIALQDEYGCKAADTVKITVKHPNSFVIPNAFSPNNDGVNDIFKIDGFNIAQIDLMIYNRWGEQVFKVESVPLTTGWNGIYKEQICEVAVFVYYAVVYYYDGSKEVQKGNVTLLR